MKKGFIGFILLVAASVGVVPQANAQFDAGRALSALVKGAQALTLSDNQVAAYVRESVNYMDSHNKVCGSGSPYTARLNRITANLKSADGIPLNFKVYQVNEVNAFACPDGSVRVFSALMDIMTDDELLGVIGHEIGHVAMHHSKKALKNELMTGALRDAISSAGGWAASLSDSQLGALGQSLIGAKFSRKQEKEADDYGYNFLKKNGKNPWGMVMAFEKLGGADGKSSYSYVQKMFSSHPETKERIKRLSQRATKDGYRRPSN